jgi:DNA mismatch endonuclease (patch repair protein)
MADIVDTAKISRMMSGIRGKNTKPELVVRQFLQSRGFRYRLHLKTLASKPDLVLPKYRAVIFVHGCYWHRHENCQLAYNPKSREDFWQEKFRLNVRRDEKAFA